MKDQFKYRVLLVDDDEALLLVTAAVLSNEGYAIETARDGFEALAQMREIVPDIVVSDLKMPNMSGFELLEVVRKRFPATGVIARSGEFSPIEMPEGVLADKYVMKGVNSDFELLEAIRQLLSEAPKRAQSAKVDIAPAWLPRSQAGYIVVTCPSCLRSFSLLRRNLACEVICKDECIHCGSDVSYRIDTTTAKECERSSTAERLQRTRNMISDSRDIIAESKKRTG